MAIYHLSVKTISRSAGRSATAAAAYRAGDKIADERTGEIHDYTRKGGVESAEIVLPADAPQWAANRSALWNAAERSETRKNSTVAREFEIALPDELSASERKRLAHDLAREIVARHGCAADVAIHAPGREGDNRNHHAHILLSTRRLTADGFTEKTRELDDQKTGKQLVSEWRERFAELQNERFKELGITASVDHRSLAAQGLDREPTQHLGVAATGFERRSGEPSHKRLAFEQESFTRLAAAFEAGELERAGQQADASIIDLTSQITALNQEKEQQDHDRRHARNAAFAGVTDHLRAAGANIIEAGREHGTIEILNRSIESAIEQRRAKRGAGEEVSAIGQCLERFGAGAKDLTAGLSLVIERNREEQAERRAVQQPVIAVDIAAGMAAFKAKFELDQQIKAGMQRALEAFERQKAERTAQESEQIKPSVDKRRDGPDF
ncbi:MAG: MobA/MobL family protein [Acidocella sp.]|nr:MobA/MobL family protein [Acidocella sp.]